MRVELLPVGLVGEGLAESSIDDEQQRRLADPRDVSSFDPFFVDEESADKLAQDEGNYHSQGEAADNGRGRYCAFSADLNKKKSCKIYENIGLFLGKLPGAKEELALGRRPRCCRGRS